MEKDLNKSKYMGKCKTYYYYNNASKDKTISLKHSIPTILVCNSTHSLLCNLKINAFKRITNLCSGEHHI